MHIHLNSVRIDGIPKIEKLETQIKENLNKALREGDELVYNQLIDKYGPAIINKVRKLYSTYSKKPALSEPESILMVLLMTTNPSKHRSGRMSPGVYPDTGS